MSSCNNYNVKHDWSSHSGWLTGGCSCSLSSAHSLLQTSVSAGPCCYVLWNSLLVLLADCGCSPSVVGVRTPLHSTPLTALLAAQPVLSSVRCQPHTEQHHSVSSSQSECHHSAATLPGHCQHHHLPDHPHHTQWLTRYTRARVRRRVKWKHFVSLTCSSDGTGWSDALGWKVNTEYENNITLSDCSTHFTQCRGVSFFLLEKHQTERIIKDNNRLSPQRSTFLAAYGAAVTQHLVTGYA